MVKVRKMHRKMLFPKEVTTRANDRCIQVSKKQDTKPGYSWGLEDLESSEVLSQY